MTPFTLSAATQAAINAALANGGTPGTNNANYLTAYNDIYNDLVAQNAAGNIIDPGVLAWFSQAGLVNTEQFHATQAGAFIWGYTEAAAISEGATISTANMQTASNTIALNVFKTLANNDGFVFNSNGSNGDFSIQKIVANDAGAGVQVLKDDYQSAQLDNAIWGGTLFAATELNDPTYFSDFNVTLGVGSRDAAAIVAGFETGAFSALQASGFSTLTAAQNVLNIDWSTLAKASLGANAPNLLSSWLSSPNWTFGAASSPTSSGNQVANGNIEIYDNANGYAVTLTGSTNSAGDGVIYQPTGTSGTASLPTSGLLSVMDASNSGAITDEIVSVGSGGAISFTDELGDEFASYTATQAAGGSIQINGNGINAYNSSGQIENSTQSINLSTGVFGILDNSWSYAAASITKVDDPGQSQTTLYLKDDGTGLAVSGTNTYFYQNGTETAVTIPSITGHAGQFYVDDNGDVIERLSGSSAGSVIYSGGQAGYTGGSTSSLLGPNGQTFEVFGVSRSGNTIIGYTQSSNTTTWYVKSNGVFTQVNLPSYTDTNGNVQQAFAKDINDNSQIVLTYNTSLSGANSVVSAIYNYHTGANTILAPDPNGAFGTLAQSINNSGVVVGFYSDASGADHAFTYSNGSYADVNIPGVTPFENSTGRDWLSASEITNTGTLVVESLSTTFSSGITTEDAYSVTPGSGSSETSTFEVAGSGTVDLSSVTQLTSTATINLLASGDTVTVGANLETINGSGNDTFNVGSTAAVGDVINDTVGNNTVSAASSGLTVHVRGGSGNNNLTLGNGSNNWLDAEQTSGNNSLSAGSGTNNTLDVSFSSGNNTLTSLTGSSDYLNAQSTTGANTLQVGDANSDTLSVAFSTRNNSLTAGNGTGDYLNAESSQGANTLVAGNGANDTLDVSFSSGNNTVAAGSGNGDYLNAQSSSGNNVLTAGSGSGDTFSALYATGRNTFNAGTGNTTLAGGEGYTTYKFGSAFGQDIIYNGGSSFGTGASATQGEVDFGSGVNYEKLWFTQSGNDLVVQLLGTSDTVTVKGWFSGTAGTQVQTFNAGGLSLASTAVASLVSAMATYQSAHSSFNPSTATQMPGDTALQAAITNAWPGSANANGVTVAVAMADQATLDTVAGGYKVVDTAANVVGGLAFLTSDASHIASITLTDSATPTLSLTAAQYSADAAALAKIGSAYNLAISGVSAANASTVASAAHVTSITVSDTAANVVANMTALETLATTGSVLSSITLTDGSTPTLALTAAQYAADTAALAKIGSTYNLSISGVTAANASSTAAAAHVTSITVSDTAANVLVNISALETLATGTELSSITLTDGSTPTLALTSAQYSADTAALGKISSAYNLSVSGVTAANASTVAGGTHVTSITVSDTGANVVSNIASLETVATNGKLSSITLTDGSTPTLALTASQFTADGAALAKIGSNYNLSIAQSGVNFVFAKNALLAASVNGSSVTFTVNSAATGFTETITWTPGNRALLNLTNASNQTFSSSLSSLSSGETVQVTSSMITVLSSAGVAQNATQVNADGSQNDINYNTSGSGSWVSNTYTYNATGTLISIGWLNNDGSTWTSYYDSNGTLQANVSVNANGSGYVATNNNQTLNFAAGDALSNISVTTSGTVNVTVTPSGHAAETLSLTSSGITSTIGGHTLSDTLSGTNASIDGSGNITFTAPATGFGNDTLVANTNDTFTLGSDSLTFAGYALQGISFAGGAFTYNIPSAASGYNETLTWNPTSGKAILNITNSSNNQNFATSLGYINPGYVLSVNSTGSSLTNTNASGQALYTTQVNADGSQNDISYDAPGGSEFDNIYSYSASGVLTEIQYNNNNGTFVHDFYNASGTLTGQTIYNGGSTLYSTNSNITAENTSGMTTLNVTGSTTLTASELSSFTSLTNGTGSADTLYASTAGTYSIAGKTVTGNFNLSAANTTANVTLAGNNQSGQTLTGGAGADTLIVGTGNDTLNGGTGYTTYDFGSSFGQDTVNNAFAGNTTTKGEIDFTSGSVTDENLWFQQSGNDLLVKLLGTSDQIDVSGWFGSNAGADVQAFNAGGLKLDSQVAALVSAMASYASAHSGFNPATASSMPTDTTLQNAIAASWHH